MKQCPVCKTKVQDDVTLCPLCHTRVTSPITSYQIFYKKSFPSWDSARRSWDTSTQVSCSSR